MRKYVFSVRPPNEAFSRVIMQFDVTCCIICISNNCAIYTRDG